MITPPKSLGHSIAKILLSPAKPWLSSMLLSAVRRCDMPSARRLLILGANPDARGSDGFTPLTINHTQSDQACASMAKLLISHGALPDLPTISGLRPLHYAAQFALPELCLALFEGGADPMAPDARGETAIDKLRAFQSQGGYHRVDDVSAIEAIFERKAIATALPAESKSCARKASRL